MTIMTNTSMQYPDGWPEIWTRLSDERLEQELYEYLLLEGTPGGQDRRIDQLIAEASRRNKKDIVERARERAKQGTR